MITRTFVDHEGKRHYARAETLEEAIVKRERMKAELEKDRRTSSTPFKSWAETALDAYKPNVSDKYRACMKSRLEKHILPRLGSLPIGKILPIQCQAVLNDSSEMSRSHIKKVAQEMFFYFDTARKNGLVQKNPAEDLVRPKGYQRKRRALTEEEREAFLKICKKYPAKFNLFKLMLYCGCRPAEAWGVNYEDVKKEKEAYYLHIRGTKTDNSDRFVPVCKEVYPVLLKRATGRVARTEIGSAFNSTSYKRLVERLKREMNIAMGARLYKNQIVEPALSEDFVPYMFRHTFCTDLKKKGVDIRIAKNLMGHADIRTTANIYDHDDGETLRLAAEQMGAVFD